MASNSRWPSSDMQGYAPQGRKSSAMSHATSWDYDSNDGLGCSDWQGSDRSFQPWQTAEETSSRSFQQYTPSSESRAPSRSPYAVPDELWNSSDPSYPTIRHTQDYLASSSIERGRRTGSEGYPMQAWQNPLMAEDQSWKQSLSYTGHQQRSEEYNLHSNQPTQSDDYSTGFGDTHQPQQYSSNLAPSSYLDINRMASIATSGRSSYLPFMTPVAGPSIVVHEVQDDHICGHTDDQSSPYQDFLGTNESSVSGRGVSVSLNAQRSSTRTPNRNHRNHRTHNDMADRSDLEESAEGLLGVPRTPKRGQRDDDPQRRRRHLTDEGREHAKDVRRAQACKNCRRRKTKVCFVWSSGFALLLIPSKSQCRHVLERDQVSTPSSPGVQRDDFTTPRASSSPQPLHYHSPLTVQPALYSMTINDFSYCPSPSPLPRAYTDQTYTDHYLRY